MTANLEVVRRNIERLAAEAARKRDGLYRDGKPVYAPDSHAMNMNNLLAPLRQAVEDAQAVAKDVETEARKLEALAHVDPLSRLSTEELQRLAAAAVFAKDDIAELTEEQLPDRLRAVLYHGDTVSKILHLRYVPVRARDSMTVRKLIADIDTAVNGAENEKAAKAAAKAEALRKEASELSFYASKTLADVDGSTAEADRQRMAAYAAF